MVHSELRDQAIYLRKRGYSYSEIKKELEIPKSTLSGWFKDLVLDESAKRVLDGKRKGISEKARHKAALAHREAKLKRLAQANIEAEETLNGLELTKPVKEVFLAALYLAEGSKKGASTSFCNANPLIIKAFVSMLREIYSVDEKKFRVHLLLRADQDEQTLKEFWSRTVKIPITQFMRSHFDNRSQGKKSYATYFGVCVIYYYDVRIQRKLLALSDLLIKAIMTRARSSVG